jgi:hypothetical protein
LLLLVAKITLFTSTNDLCRGRFGTITQKAFAPWLKSGASVAVVRNRKSLGSIKM